MMKARSSHHSVFTPSPQTVHASRGQTTWTIRFCLPETHTRWHQPVDLSKAALLILSEAHQPVRQHDVNRRRRLPPPTACEVLGCWHAAVRRSHRACKLFCLWCDRRTRLLHTRGTLAAEVSHSAVTDGDGLAPAGLSRHHAKRCTIKEQSHVTRMNQRSCIGRSDNETGPAHATCKHLLLLSTRISHKSTPHAFYMMAHRLLSCCRALGFAYSSDSVCQQLPRIPGLVQPWVATDEPSLKQLLSYTLTKCHGARVIADDWSVNGQTNLGLGDLVAELPCGAHLVIETKYLNVRTTGATAKRRRNNHRSYLAQQVQTYGRLWQEMLQQQGDNRPVIYASFDNEKGLEYHAPALTAGRDAPEAAVSMETAPIAEPNPAGHHEVYPADVEATISQGLALGFGDSSSSSRSCSGGDSQCSGGVSSSSRSSPEWVSPPSG